MSEVGISNISNIINSGKTVSSAALYTVMKWAYPAEWKGWLLGAVGGLLSSITSPTGSNMSRASLISSTWISSLVSTASTVSSVTNKLVKVTIDPNIAGIPIKSASEDISRNIDVSEQSVIIEQNTAGRQYVTDSAAPKPREFHVTGYVTTLSHLLDTGWLIKPTLKFQMNWLDGVSKIRIPIWYKTYYGEMIRVLITDLKFTQDPKVQNAVAVDVTLREYIPLTISMDTYGNNSSNEVDTSTISGAVTDCWNNVKSTASSVKSKVSSFLTTENVTKDSACVQAAGLMYDNYAQSAASAAVSTISTDPTLSIGGISLVDLSISDFYNILSPFKNAL